MADVLGFFKKAFPFISAGLSVAGPPGNLAASVLKVALGLDNKTAGDPADPAKIISSLSTLALTPEQQAALAKAELDYQARMAEMGYKQVTDLEALGNADRASARDLQAKTQSKVPAVLAVSITMGFFGVVTFMLLRAIPQSGHDALMLILGSLATAWTSVVAYYFGSSKGSADKTALLAQAPPVPKQ